MLVVRRELLRFALNRLDALTDLAAMGSHACGHLADTLALAADKVCDRLDLIPTGTHERATLGKEIH